MHRPRSTFILAVALCALLPPATAAAGGIYLGGGIGVAKTTDRVDALSALDPVELFARVGGMRYDLTKSAGDLGTEFDGTAPIYGVGARFGLFGLGVRAEYEKMDIDELDDAEMFSVSAFFEF